MFDEYFKVEDKVLQKSSLSIDLMFLDVTSLVNEDGFGTSKLKVTMKWSERSLSVKLRLCRMDGFSLVITQSKMCPLLCVGEFTS